MKNWKWKNSKALTAFSKCKTTAYVCTYFILCEINLENNKKLCFLKKKFAVSIIYRRIFYRNILTKKTTSIIAMDKLNGKDPLNH